MQSSVAEQFRVMPDAIFFIFLFVYFIFIFRQKKETRQNNRTYRKYTILRVAGMIICHYEYDSGNLSMGSNDKLFRGVFVGGI